MHVLSTSNSESIARSLIFYLNIHICLADGWKDVVENDLEEDLKNKNLTVR